MVWRGIPACVAMAISDQKARGGFDRYKIVSKSDLHEAAKKLAQQDQERDALQPSQTNQSHSSDVVEASSGSVASTAKLN
jgi:hypothetical protein